MNKRELAKVEILKANKEWKNEIIEIKKRKERLRWIIKAEKIEVYNENIIVVYIFDTNEIKQGREEATYRMFINDKKEYITQDLSSKKRKWRTGTIESLIGWQVYGFESEITQIDNISSKIITGYLKSLEKEPLMAIAKYQFKILKEKLKIKNENIINSIIKKMGVIKELPKDFSTWVDKEALYESRYIYYEYTRAEKKQGYCTHCKKKVTAVGAKHNKEGICPKCKSKIKYKSIGKAGNVKDKETVTLIQRANKKEIVIRHFSVLKDYTNYKKPQLGIWERQRIFLQKDSVKVYEFGEFKQSGKNCWCDKAEYLFHTNTLYINNLENELKNTEWQYSAIKQYAEHVKKFDVEEYMTTYNNVKALEYLVKLGFYNLIKGLAGRYYGGKVYLKSLAQETLNLEGTTLKEIFSLNKDEIRMLQEIDPCIEHVEKLKQAKKYGIKINKEQLEYATKSKVNFETLIMLSKYTTINKIFKYLLEKGNSYIEWRDYITNCIKLGYKLNEFIMYPRNLKKEHDRVYKIIQDKKTEIRDKEVKEVYKRMKYLEFENKQFKIIVPKNSIEIQREGAELHHCVATYIERVCKKKSIILFIREKSDIEKPFYTMEIINNKVEQVRGKCNCEMTDEIEKFIEQFKIQKLEVKELRKAM